MHKTFACVGALSLAVALVGHAADQPQAGERTDPPFRVEEHADRLSILHAGQPLATYVFADDAILRPYFANLRSLQGVPVTRTQPPVEGVDAVDHATMHPGVWLGFGDVSGHDFWRNKGRIEHLRFSESPAAEEDRLTFATESRMIAGDGTACGRVTNRYVLSVREGGWLLTWTAEFQPGDAPLVFGDQEEMGFGVRMATPLTEKNGGRITNSAGQTTAAATWGQPAAWCDYSGRIDGRAVGVTLLAAPSNFRTSWWHNRDYGLMVANPFGRAAMHQGDPSRVVVNGGETLKLKFAAWIHDGAEFDPRQGEQLLRSLAD